MQAVPTSSGQPESLPFDRTWTFEQTAQYLCVSEDTLRDWMQKCLIPFHQIIRFVPEEVLAHLSAEVFFPTLAQRRDAHLERMPAMQQSNEQSTTQMRFPDRMNMEQTEVYLGIKRRKIDYLKANGQLPYIKIGRRVVFDRRDLDAFLRAHRL